MQTVDGIHIRSYVIRLSFSISIAILGAWASRPQDFPINSSVANKTGAFAQFSGRDARAPRTADFRLSLR
jgi:hypothetical protein